VKSSYTLLETGIRGIKKFKGERKGNLNNDHDEEEG
jgi:hypothetical protein